MTPFEHYQAAEQCIKQAAGSEKPGLPMAYLAEAQVHATLALAGDLSGAWES